MMSNLIPNVKVFSVNESGANEVKFSEPVNLKLEYHPQGVLVNFLNAKSKFRKM